MSVLILEYSSLVLPVSLINFDLQTLDNQTIKLFWSTATEQIVISKQYNVKTIAIEHFADGIYFMKTDQNIYKFIVKH